MRFKLDENLPADLVPDFIAAGHDADTVAEEGMAGASDSDLLARVRSERRVLLTMDRGIGDVRA